MKNALLIFVFLMGLVFLLVALAEFFSSFGFLAFIVVPAVGFIGYKTICRREKQFDNQILKKTGDDETA